MELVWAAIFLVGVSQLSSGNENFDSNRPSHHLLKRNIMARSPTSEISTNKESPDEVVPGRIVYQLNDELRPIFRPSLSYEGLPSADSLDGDAFLANDVDALPKSFTDLNAPFVYAARFHQPQLPQWQNDGSDQYMYENSNSKSNSLQVNNSNNNNQSSDEVDEEEERLIMQKRLQMKGMGLLGSTKNQPSLAGFSKSRPKSLVLSIDLGIKALRDAIMHAKLQQKNRQHKMQAQKNMRLLHNIGKRRATSWTHDRV
ncbi:UNVERIFIED_CONTAM: hypothetical protein RMT77_012682 [Armadillidium vulgare]